MSEFSERLKRAVERSGQTHGWVAARFNELAGTAVTSATVGRWINGVNEPRLDFLPHLAKVLGISPALLTFGEEVVTPTAAQMDAIDARRGIGGGTHAKRPAGKRRRAEG